MSYCGPQYTGKNCTCLPQVTPGLTPATQSAANITYICAYQANGIQYGCDPGCCPQNPCSNVVPVASTTSAPAVTTPPPLSWLSILMIVLSVLYAIVLVIGVAYRSKK